MNIFVLAYLISWAVSVTAINKILAVFLGGRKTPMWMLLLSVFGLYAVSAFLFLAFNMGVVSIAANILLIALITMNYEATWRRRFAAIIGVLAILNLIEFAFAMIVLEYFAPFFERIGTADGDATSAWVFFAIATLNYTLAVVLGKLKNIRKGEDKIALPLYGAASIAIPVATLFLMFWAFVYLPTLTGVIVSTIMLGINLALFYLRDALSAAFYAKTESMRAMLGSSPLACAVLGQDFSIVDANGQVSELFGISRQKYMENPFALSPEKQPDGRLSSEKAKEILASAFEQGYAHCEWMHQTSEGEAIPCELTLVRVELSGKPMVIYYIRDLRELKEVVAMKEQLEKLAFTDGLTNLYNRRFFTDTAGAMLRRCRKDGQPFAALIMDVDHFKKVNDAHGHSVGDEVLKILATRLKSAVRQDAAIARYGGEEFIVALPSCDSHSAMKAAERIREKIGSSPFNIDDTLSLPVTISIGAVVDTGGESELADVVDKADKALYEAKNTGRNRVVLAEIT